MIGSDIGRSSNPPAKRDTCSDMLPKRNLINFAKSVYILGVAANLNSASLMHVSSKSILAKQPSASEHVPKLSEPNHLPFAQSPAVLRDEPLAQSAAGMIGLRSGSGSDRYGARLAVSAAHGERGRGGPCDLDGRYSDQECVFSLLTQATPPEHQNLLLKIKTGFSHVEPQIPAHA